MATGPGMGMVEIVKDSETLREIHTEFGLTGSFKDEPIHLGIQKHNPGEKEYRHAVQNFTASCAGNFASVFDFTIFTIYLRISFLKIMFFKVF